MNAEITYYVRVTNASGNDDTPLTAKTDTGARRQASAYLREHPAKSDDLVSLRFFRRADGCDGEIDF